MLANLGYRLPNGKMSYGQCTGCGKDFTKTCKIHFRFISLKQPYRVCTACHEKAEAAE